MQYIVQVIIQVINQVIMQATMQATMQDIMTKSKLIKKRSKEIKCSRGKKNQIYALYLGHHISISIVPQ